jgi:hypothetical protein
VGAGTITATVGLAILAVGVTALIRSQWLGQFTLRRPGLIFLAVGQGLLLLGLATRAVHRIRPGVRTGTSAGPIPMVAAPAIWPSVVPMIPMHAGFPWLQPVANSPSYRSTDPGQITQLKAQLEALSQELDKLSQPAGGHNAHASN